MRGVVDAGRKQNLAFRAWGWSLGRAERLVRRSLVPLRAVAFLDFLLLAALIALTALFGRPFARIGVESARLYVTEIVIAMIAGAALLRCGFRGAFARVRTVVPLGLLLTFWVAGAIAAARGVSAVGLRRTTQDIGLVEYSVFLPLLAIVVDTPAKARVIVRGLPYLGAAATAVFAVVFFVAPYGRLGIFQNPPSASGIYLALVAIPVIAALVYGVRVNAVLVAAAGGALILMSLLATRSIVVALIGALGATVLLAGRGRWLRGLSIAAVAGVLSVLGAGVLHAADIGVRAALPVPAPPEVPLEADDAIGIASGGVIVRSDSARGTAAREMPRGVLLEIPRIGGLEKGERYTVAFSVKPLRPIVTRGLVGDTSGLGWGAADWTTKARTRWHRFLFSLVATSSTERLVVWASSGSPRIRVDSLSVHETRPGDGSALVPPNRPGKGEPLPNVQKPTVLETFTNTFDPADTTGERANARWRLDYWKFVMSEVKDEPILGVGFGHAANFRWEGIFYDARAGDASDPNDVTPPHNSFLNVLYRMGLLGFLPLLGLMTVTVWRTWKALRQPATKEERRWLMALGALFAFVSVTASFNVALEGPYMGIFFWTTLALLLIVTHDRRWLHDAA